MLYPYLLKAIVPRALKSNLSTCSWSRPSSCGEGLVV